MTDENTPTDPFAAAPEGEQPVRRTRARRVATSGTTTVWPGPSPSCAGRPAINSLVPIAGRIAPGSMPATP